MDFHARNRLYSDEAGSSEAGFQSRAEVVYAEHVSDSKPAASMSQKMTAVLPRWSIGQVPAQQEIDQKQDRIVFLFKTSAAAAPAGACPVAQRACLVDAEFGHGPGGAVDVLIDPVQKLDHDPVLTQSLFKGPEEPAGEVNALYGGWRRRPC